MSRPRTLPNGLCAIPGANCRSARDIRSATGRAALFRRTGQPLAAPSRFFQICAERNGQLDANVWPPWGADSTRAWRDGAMSRCGRARTSSVRETQRNPPLKRTSLSRRPVRITGASPAANAPVILRRMERDGLLPPSQRRSTRVLRPAISRPAAVPGPRPSDPSAASPAPKKASSGTLAATSALRLRPAQRFVLSMEGELPAVLGAAAWKTAPRDKFVGAAGAPCVVNNARFLPWVGIKHLASPRAGRTTTALGKPVCLALLETFCESLAGACYRAANWIPDRQSTRPRQGEKRICAAGQGRQASSTGQEENPRSPPPGSERLPAKHDPP